MLFINFANGCWLDCLILGRRLKGCHQSGSGSKIKSALFAYVNDVVSEIPNEFPRDNPVEAVVSI